MSKKNKQTNENDNEHEKETKGMCFTIMPFGGWYDDYYKEVFLPAIKAANMKPRRADDVFRPGTIVQDIWNYTKKADIILADLSDKNANVLYELGLAHAIAKPAILVTESLDDIPFDLRALRVIEFDKNAPNWGKILENKITRAINEIFENPLQSIPAAFLEIDEAQKTKKVSPNELELLEIKQDIDQLKKEVRSRRISRPSRMGPDEAKSNIREMVENGVPDYLIVDVLTRQGVPESFVDTHINRYKHQTAEDDIPF